MSVSAETALPLSFYALVSYPSLYTYCSSLPRREVLTTASLRRDRMGTRLSMRTYTFILHFIIKLNQIVQWKAMSLSYTNPINL